MVTLRQLTIDDAESLCALRRQALLDSPWSFETSPEEDYSTNPEIVRQKLSESESAVFATALNDDPAHLIAMTGVVRMQKAKSRHRALIWGVFCDPAHRRQGYALALMKAAIDLAFSWPGVETIGLGVSENAPEARALYEALGFRAWGTEPDALRIDGRSYAETYLALDRESSR